MRVMKFGGTSLGSAVGLGRVVDLVEEAWEEEEVLVVASALSGVTQTLLEIVEETGPACVSSADEGWFGTGDRGAPDPIAELQNRHLGLLEELKISRDGERGWLEDKAWVSLTCQILEELRILRWVARAHGFWTPASKDRALGIGERLSSHLLVAALRARGNPARSVDAGKIIRTDSVFGSARVLEEETKRLVRETLGNPSRAELPVVPGFTGADEQGRPTTLGRGTSDYTAPLLASALSARLVEIWTDVDGIHVADPRCNPETPLLHRIGYGEARAMALGGAKVLHPRSLDPIEAEGIPLQVRNTFNPSGSGTLVGSSPSSGRIVNLVVAGAPGGVGRALLAQLQKTAPRLLQEDGLELRVAGLVSSRAHLWFQEGIPLSDLPDSPLIGPPPDWKVLVRSLVEHPPLNPLFVDCTASPEVAGLYLPLLRAGVPVVTPNKLSVSGALAAYHQLGDAARQAGVPFRYETTVGAALPFVRTIRELCDSGHQIRRIEGVLSGTLSFVFSRLSQGVPFSQAVREAREAGFTEPHPGEDLSGADVGRKLLILCREAGFDLEASSIQIRSLVPVALAKEEDPEAFLKGLEGYDEEWNTRISEAEEGRLAYVAEFLGEDGGRVGVKKLPAGDPLAALRATENMLVVGTDRYLEVPLTISGPGAGWEVTASGVLVDILAAIRERYPRKTFRGAGEGSGASTPPKNKNKRKRRVA